MSAQIPIDDLDAGDDSPKLARVSLKDVVLAVNRLSYTFKTPDDLVAPDALQLNADGNLALGNVPKLLSEMGRSFWLSNTSTSGGLVASTNMLVESASGLAFVSVKTTNGGNGMRYWDGTSSATPRVQTAWFPTENLWRMEVFDGTLQRTAYKVGQDGKIGITGGAVLQNMLNVGTVGGTGNELWVASNTTNFEGVFLGAYDDRSGGKIDLNAQANSTTVSSWRMSHDFNDGGQGRLSFRMAAAAANRAALSYTERVAFTNSNVFIGGGASRATASAHRYVQIEHAGNSSISMTSNINDISGSNLTFAKTRSTTRGGSTIVQDGDGIGGMNFVGANGTDLSLSAANISVFVSGTPTATSIPGQIIFSTTKPGNSTVTEAMRITNNQNVSLGGASDVAKLVLIKGVTYTGGEAMLYMQTSNPGTIPVMITGSSSGTTQISGGSPLASGGARGGQIDLIAGGAASYAGHVFLRAGTATDGLSNPVIMTVAPTGKVGINNQAPEHRIHFTGIAGERVRVMGETFGEYAGFTGRRANGVPGTPTKILANDALLFMNAHGYTGTQYTAAGQITIQAEADWSDTNSPTSIVFAPGVAGNLGQASRMIIRSSGNVGINAPTPVSVFNVTSSANPSGVGFEVDPDTLNAYTQFRSYDRTTAQYKGWAEAANYFSWGVGTTTASTIMALTPAGNFAIGPNANTYVAGTGTGAAAIEGRMIIAATASTTALNISVGEKYAGMKIKAGPVNTGNGTCDYYDITTRPGISGVANNNDYTMIRMESGVSKSNPDMYLQTSQAGGRIVMGTDTSTASARLVVSGFNGGGNIVNIGGNTSGIANADVVISRSGATVSTGAGRGASIQLSNGTNNTHILLQETSNSLQTFNWTGSVWTERTALMADGRFIIGGQVNVTTASDTLQVRGTASSGNDYCMIFNATTATTAYAARFFSVTSQALAGSITFTGSATAFNVSSDRRLKENIVDAPAARDMIDAITVRSFNFKKAGDYFKYGFVAQELYQVAPFAVTKGSDDNEEFCPLNGVWGVDNSKLIPAMVKAHQEVSAELKSTKDQLLQTQGELEALKTMFARLAQRVSELDGK